MAKLLKTGRPPDLGLENPNVPGRLGGTES
jgi:hypothetical protein